MSFTELLTFIAGAGIGGLLSWLISHRYYIKGGADQRIELQRLSEGIRPRNTLRDFETYLDECNWTKTVVGNAEVWMAEADNTFQIERGESSREFQEKWTTVYPDPNTSAHSVYLKINGTTIKELIFISMDGGRIFVPMVGVRQISDGTTEYFWNPNSLEVKVCKFIGTYYLYDNLEGVARMSKVAMV